jgi:hypothetical protein
MIARLIARLRRIDPMLGLALLSLIGAVFIIWWVHP